MADGGDSTFIFDGAGCGQSNPSTNYTQVCNNTASSSSVGTAIGPAGCCNALTMGTAEGYISPWKYESGKATGGCGSAPDGDEDAIWGLIYAAEQSGAIADQEYALKAILAFILQDIGYGANFDKKTVEGNAYWIVKGGSW